MYTKKETRTYRDRAEYIKQAVIKRRSTVLRNAKALLGSKCCICGYNKCQRALSFHHIDPSKKSFGISANGLTRSWAKVQEEVSKCILVCANCHMEIHEGITQLPKEILE